MPDWITQFPGGISVNIKDIIDNAIKYMVVNWGSFFDGLTAFLRVLLAGVGSVVNNIPWWLLILIVFLLILKIRYKIFLLLV